MKKLSDTLKELGIDFRFPIIIKDARGNETYTEYSNRYYYRSEYDARGNETYFEDSDGYWNKCEYDANGNQTYFENSDDYWFRSEYDANGNKTYYEDSNDFWCKREYDADGKETYYEDRYGRKKGTPKSSKVEPINPDAATFEVTITKKEHDIILSLSVPASPSPKMT